jgi:hypothetical protein
VAIFNLFHKTKIYSIYNKRTLNVIKEFFFYHHGDSMMMYRNDPEKYKKYRALSNEIIEEWSQELIAQDFEFLLAATTENKGMVVDDVINLLWCTQYNVEKNFQKLLDIIIAISPTLEKRQRILILERFAGRSASQKDGAIYLISTTTSLKPLVKTAIKALVDFSVDKNDNVTDIGWRNMQQRYEKVQQAIEYALETF